MSRDQSPRQNSRREHNWRQLNPDDLDNIEDFEPIRRTGDNALPASSKRASKNAARKTNGSRRVSKKISQQVGGMNRRRSKRFD